MIKKSIRMLIIGLILAMQTDLFARANKAVAQHVHKNQLQQNFSDESRSNIQNQPKQKNVAKNRQRMSAAKIAGMVAAVLLGAAVVGLLMGAVIVPFITFLIF